MNEETREQLEKILWKHKAVFRKDPVRLTSYKHHLQVKENQPFIGWSYPIPMAYREKVDEEIKNMLDMGITQRSSSPYINPIIPVIKKDGTVRLCLDARKLNDILLEDWECPEPAEVLIRKCKRIKIMSSLDMTSSFWQVPLQAESKKYTAFQHRGKSYEFNVVPFGLKTNTAALVRGLDHLVNFYSKFISKDAEETVPLLNLIKKGVPWKWDENMQRSFNKAKQLFCETITLYFPDPRKSYYLETDASNYALGAILYQKNDKNEKEIITLARKTLKGPEMSFFTTEKELLAIVWALQKFQTYL